VGVFSVNGGVNFTVQNLTIANGNSEGGGGIYSDGGTLTVTNSTFSGNSATYGGGIYNEGTLTVTDSTFSDNSATYGGGIYNGGTLTITNSTFSGNSAFYGSGGGISNYSTVTVTNSTFSGNTAASEGGGIYNYSTVTVTNSTFSGNNAGDEGGGIYNYVNVGTGTVTNTIVANSTSGGNCAGSVIGRILDGGNNIDDGMTCGFTGTGCTNTSTSGTSLCNTNPLLDPTGLQNNGGPTQTIALCTGTGAPSAGCTGVSPAINAGNESVCSTTTGTAPVDSLDQRGFVRPGAGATNCSIGAYEAGASCVGNSNCSDGSSCTNSSQCTGGECDSTALTCCGQTADCNPGTSCTAASQCRSGTCAGGVCVEPTSTPTPASTPPAPPTPTRAAACVVGTGTGASCTESALDACLPGGGSFDGTVTFNCGGAATITVTSTKTISADTTIDGGSLITISGGNSVGVFSVNGGVNFTVQNLTIANGNSEGGGGIYSDGGTLTVTNSIFTGNSATGATATNSCGGAIDNEGNSLTVTNSTFSGNSATAGIYNAYGGGICSGGWNGGSMLTVTNSTFSGNSATAGIYNAYGGGIFSYGALTVTNSTFSDNSAVGGASGGTGGGGIISNGSTLTVTNSTFSGNSAGYPGIGGGIYIYGDQAATVTNSTFSGNSAAGGAGISSYGPLTVTNSTFSGNSAGYGGGIFNPGSSVTVTSSTFSNNSAGNYGGGIVNEGNPSSGNSLMVTDSTFSGNSAGNYGGGVYNEGNSVTVTNSTFSSNSAGTSPADSPGDYGGGIYNGGTSLTVTNTIVANSTSGGNCGGAVTDRGHNIDDGTTCRFRGTGCRSTSGSSFCSTNPLLDPTGLQNNGGPTQTIALEAGSPAINAGNESVCAAAPVDNLDQRGFVRPGTGATNCSIGAYEANSAEPCIDNCSDGSGCTSASQCTGGACDSSSNSCCGQTNDCNDGTSCTSDSQCRGGTCAGGVCAGALVPPNSSKDTCEDTVAQNINKLVVCTANCQTKEADYALQNKSFVETACEQGSGTPTSCRAAYDKAETAVLAKKKVKQAICPPCLGGTAQTALAESAVRVVHDLDGEIYCAGTTGFASGNAGYVPPDKNTGACEDTVSRNLRTLAGCITKCQKEDPDTALKDKPFDVQACEEGTGKPTSCLAAYDKAQAAVLAKTATVNKQKVLICPACLDATAQGALADAMISFIDQSSDGQIYCAGTVPLPTIALP